MDFSALGRCHQQVHPVPRRSSLSSASSSKIRFSGFFIVPAGTRMFCLGMLTLVLTWPWNPPSAYAWNFSNDGIPAPPIAMDLDAPSAPPPALPSDGPLATPPEVPPSPSLAPTSTSWPSENPSSISVVQRSSVTVIVPIVLVAFICLTVLVLYCYHVSRRLLRIFISHARDPHGPGEKYLTWLNKEMQSRLGLKYSVKIILATDTLKFIRLLARFDVGIVVVTKEYFGRKGPMIELIDFVKAHKKDRTRFQILSLFYGLSLEELELHLNRGTWEDSWKEMAKGPHPIEVEKCREAVTWLCNGRGIPYNSQRRDNDKLYIETVCKEVGKILCEERSFASHLRWAKTTVLESVTATICIDTEKRRRRENQRAGKEIGVMIYINKLLRLLFVFSGLLIILLSVILDNFFNDQPVRFTAFATFAPVMIFLGFLASGWFPRIPLRFVAFVKRCGFLQNVIPCSPWHDNVVTDFRGEVCSLEPLEQAEGTRLLEFPTSVRNFLYSDRIAPQGTTHSTFDSEIQDFQVAALVQEGQDHQGLTTGNEIIDFVPFSGILKRTHSKMATGPISWPNLQEAPSRVEDHIVVEIDRSHVFRILDDERAPILEFDGPEINGFPLKVQAFKNALTTDHTFDLSCTFRNRRTKRMYLTIGRLQNLVQNMYQWVLSPHPIVVDELSDILHCMAIEDILWEFTKTIYTFRPVHVEHRFLAGLGQVNTFVQVIYASVTCAMALIPLLSDQKSLFFLFFLLALAPFLFSLCDTKPLTLYRFKSLFCPVCVKVFGYNRLYKSRSSFRWCNEFRKKRIVNPSYFWIDQEYANTCPDRASCFDVCGFPEFSSPPKGQNFTMSCQGWLTQVPGFPPVCETQHEYKLKVKFDSVKRMKDVNCYTNVRLAFFENDHPLGDFNYSAIEVERINFLEQLFHRFSDPNFGGYVEKICRIGYCSTTFVAHCPRFIDVCNRICGSSNPIPTLLVASRMPGSEFIVGVPFWSSEL